MSWWNSVNISRSVKATWGLKNRRKVVAFGFVPLTGKQVIGSSGECQIPAIYNFGDSNSDTGCVSVAFHRILYPNGISFFGKPSGRYCDGRLIIDFVAEKLGLPFLNAYLDAIRANFQHGQILLQASTIQHVDGMLYGGGLNPLSLDVQLSQFEAVKEQAGELYAQDNVKNRLPTVEDF
ncbi:Alpha-L-fucosidase 3 [Bienertia sinuspersici]